MPTKFKPLMPAIPIFAALAVAAEFKLAQIHKYVDGPYICWFKDNVRCTGWPFATSTETAYIAESHLLRGTIANTICLLVAAFSTYLVVRSITHRTNWSFSVVDLMTLTTFVALSCLVYPRTDRLVSDLDQFGLYETFGYCNPDDTAFLHLGLACFILLTATTILNTVTQLVRIGHWLGRKKAV